MLIGRIQHITTRSHCPSSIYCRNNFPDATPSTSQTEYSSSIIWMYTGRIVVPDDVRPDRCAHFFEQFIRTFVLQKVSCNVHKHFHEKFELIQACKPGNPPTPHLQKLSDATHEACCTRFSSLPTCFVYSISLESIIISVPHMYRFSLPKVGNCSSLHYPNSSCQTVYSITSAISVQWSDDTQCFVWD